MKDEKLEKILTACDGYLYPMARDIWPYIRFEEYGIARLGAIFGFIRGMYSAGSVEDARQLAWSIFNAMDTVNLNNRVDDVKVGRWKFPSRLAKVNDDGGTLNLSWSWYMYITPERKKELEEEGKGCFHQERLGFTVADYVRYYNGGVIFHGWKHDPKYGRRPIGGDLTTAWGVHT